MVWGCKVHRSSKASQWSLPVESVNSFCPQCQSPHSAQSEFISHPPSLTTSTPCHLNISTSPSTSASPRCPHGCRCHLETPPYICQRILLMWGSKPHSLQVPSKVRYQAVSCWAMRGTHEGLQCFKGHWGTATSGTREPE